MWSNLYSSAIGWLCSSITVAIGQSRSDFKARSGSAWSVVPLPQSNIELATSLDNQDSDASSKGSGALPAIHSTPLGWWHRYPRSLARVPYQPSYSTLNDGCNSDRTYHAGRRENKTAGCDKLCFRAAAPVRERSSRAPSHKTQETEH